MNPALPSDRRSLARSRKIQRVRLAAIVSMPLVGALVGAFLWRAGVEPTLIGVWAAPMLTTSLMAAAASWQRRGIRRGPHQLDRVMRLPVLVAMVALPLIVRAEIGGDAAVAALVLALVSMSSLLALAGLQFRRHRKRYFVVIGALGGYYAGHVVLVADAWLAVLVGAWTINLCALVLYALRTRDDLAEISDENLRLARLDGVTGALNRGGLLAEWDERCPSSCDRSLVLLNLDRFREANDRWGPEFGDAVLAETARRLFDSLGQDGVVARLAADNFAVAIKGRIDNDFDVRRRVERALDTLERPFSHDGRVWRIRASVGAVGVSDEDFDTALASARYALGDARSWIGRMVVFDPNMRTELERKRRIDACLTESLEQGRFTWWAHPILDSETLAPTAVELLVRLNFENEILTPDRFLPQLAEANLLDELGRQTLAVAGRWLRHWRNDKELSELVVNVNLAPGHLLTTAIADVRRLVDPEDFSRLGIELVETEVIPRGAGLRRRAEALADMGCRLVLDDFGAGYSALSLLSDLQVAEVKIDRSLVSALDTDERRAKLVAAVAQLGATLGTSVVCEGVETQRELDRVRSLGVGSVQGWLFGKPMPLPRCEFELRRMSRRAARALDRPVTQRSPQTEPVA